MIVCVWTLAISVPAWPSWTFARRLPGQHLTSIATKRVSLFILLVQLIQKMLKKWLSPWRLLPWRRQAMATFWLYDSIRHLFTVLGIASYRKYVAENLNWTTMILLDGFFYFKLEMITWWIYILNSSSTILLIGLITFYSNAWYISFL